MMSLDGLFSGSADRAAGDEEDCARAAHGAHLPGGVSGHGLPGRIRLHVGQAHRKETPATAARQPRESDNGTLHKRSEVVKDFTPKCGGIDQRDNPEGAEGPERCPRG